MKQVFAVLGAFCLTGVLVFCIPFLIIFLFFIGRIVITDIAMSACIVPLSWHADRVVNSLCSNCNNYAGDPEENRDIMIGCFPNKRDLALRLMEYNDGTIASVGMDIVVQEEFDDGDQLLRKQFDDKRWNWGMQCNDNYARALMGVWKLKKNIPLSETELKEMLCNENNEMYSYFSVKRPEGAVMPADCSPYRRPQECHN